MELDLVTTSVSEEEEAVEADNCNDSADMEAETCGLCMEIVIDRGLLDCCQHWFCFACIDNWATITNLCPLCQNEFQLITCVPVYDTVGTSKPEEESFSGEDDWSVEEKNNTLSFPSYYIDENAVVCLDGNGCRIRTEPATAEGDSDLDTSIACDSCDIWYHAFCVSFDPEGTTEDTWLCPRCTAQASNESNANYSDPGNSSCQENVTGLVENSFDRKLSVSVADAGETAVVVSMVTGDHSVEEPNAIPSTSREVTKHKNETETSQVTPECEGGNTDMPMVASKIMQPKLEVEELDTSLSRDAYISFPCSMASSKFKEDSNLLEQAEVYMNRFQDSLGNFNTPIIGNKSSESHSGVDLHLEFSRGLPCVNGMKASGTETIPSEELTILSEDTLIKDDQTTVDPQATIVKTNRAKRRRADPSINEDSRAKTKAKVKTRRAKRSRPGDKVDDMLIPGDDILEDNMESSPDIMSIVQGKAVKPSKASSLRVKKIMRRSIEDKESSMVVQKLRKEIREAVRNRSAEELGKNLFDPKLLAAFRAVVTGPKPEKVTKLSPLALKARNSLLQKGKVRECLTKKIYGTSNGRRKRAWDRDCAVEFWKYRCTKTMRPKKVETLKSVLSLLRKGNSDSLGIMKESEQNSASSILSRLYLADASVLPRKDGIKPLSGCEGTTDPDKKAQIISTGNTSKQSPAMKSVETSEGGSHTSTSASNVNRNSVSLLKVPTSKQTEGAVVSSVGTSKGSTGTKKETPEMGADVKIDKRKWALEVLARKTASAKGASAGDGDGAMLKGNYPFLAQLPIDTRPTLATARHNKIPLSVRQTQLYRLTEHFLKKANLSSICRNAETELAVADAVNIEKRVADRSNSKLVYVNLCSLELSHKSENNQSSDTQAESSPSPLPAAPTEKSQEEGINKLSEPEVEAALRATGLLSDSPPGSPYSKTVSEDENGQNTDFREEKSDDILEMLSNPDLDIYGDFEYDLGDEDYVGATATTMPLPEEGLSKMKVVFSSFNSESSTGNVETTGPELIQNESSSLLVIDKRDERLLVEDATKRPSEPDKLSSGEGDEEPSAAECEELYGPEKEPLINKIPEGLSENETPGYSKRSELEKAVTPPGGQSLCMESAGGKESRGDSMSQITEKEGGDEEKTASDVNKHSNGIDFITKKVEAYIKEHIRPLCRSGVISPDQYRWAVSRTTDKVMKYHSKAKNANFLIKEGEKVKRLAEQYVEAASSKEAKK